jgi:sRNA-binding protein
MDQKRTSPGVDTRGRGIASADEQCDPLKTPAATSPLLKLPNPTVAAVIALLAERWPGAFSIHEKKRRPLKIGIHLDVMAAIDGAITHAELSRALGCYVANGAYLSRLREGAKRIALDGEPSGTVTAEQENYAKILLSMAVAKIHGWRP